MKRIPKCRTKCFIPPDNNIKMASKDSNKDIIDPKIIHKNLKFNSNRQFGNDITNSIKGNIYNDQYSRILAMDKKKNNKIYIKKHSSASQASQKNQKIKLAINDKKLKENKSGLMINKKNDISTSEYYLKNNYNYLINDYYQQQHGSKLHSSISFGMNNSRLISSNNNNCISVRLSNPKNKAHQSLNNRSINIHGHNYGIIDKNNNQIGITLSNLDLM